MSATPVVFLALTMMLAGCSSSSTKSQGQGTMDSGPRAMCVTASLSLLGPAQTPNGTYELRNVSMTSASFSATLPSGGSLELDWNGDPTSGPVAITGQIAIPSEDASTPTIWCVDSPSTLQIQGSEGTLVLTMGLQGTGLCSATGQPQPTVFHTSGCVDVST